MLPDIIRTELHQHSCNGAIEWTREELARFPAFSALPNANTVELIDTSAMIVYFSTPGCRRGLLTPDRGQG